MEYQKKYGIDFDGKLSSGQRSVTWAIEKTLEDNLYWASMQWRWLDDANFVRGPAMFFKKIPWPARPLIASLVRRQVKKNLHAHGMGRHTLDEQVLLASKTFQSLAAVLGEKPYLMGEQPCGADATVFAFMAGILCPHFDTPLYAAAEAHPSLVRYVDAMYRNYFPKNASVA